MFYLFDKSTFSVVSETESAEHAGELLNEYLDLGREVVILEEVDLL